MDFIVGLHNTSQKHDSIWVILDRLTKMASFILAHTTYTAKKYAEIYFNRILCLRGVPKMIILDHGAQFIARFWEHLQATLDTKVIRSSAYCGRTNLNYTDSSARVLNAGLPRTSNGIKLLVCRVTSR
jgi:hypothetical protein